MSSCSSYHHHHDSISLSLSLSFVQGRDRRKSEFRSRILCTRTILLWVTVRFISASFLHTQSSFSSYIQSAPHPVLSCLSDMSVCLCLIVFDICVLQTRSATEWVLSCIIIEELYIIIINIIIIMIPRISYTHSSILISLSLSSQLI